MLQCDYHTKLWLQNIQDVGMTFEFFTINMSKTHTVTFFLLQIKCELRVSYVDITAIQ